MHYISHLSISEIENRLNSDVRTGFILPSNRILSVTKKNGEIILTNILCITRMKLATIDDVTNLELTTNFHWFVYFLLIFLAIFFSGFLFWDKVTINGNPDPNILERLSFVAIGVAMSLIPFIFLVRLKSDFIKHIEKKIELNNTNH